MKFTWSRSLFTSIILILWVCLFLMSAGGRGSSGISPSAPTSGELKATGQSGEAGPWLIQPADLVSILKSAKGPRPLLIQVGFHVLYVQAHIPGSEFIGPASSPDAVRQLHKRAVALPRTQSIVLYCGCCPWSECPNVRPAYKELSAMGFKNLKILHISRNFGEDWVGKSYPVAKGK